MAMTETEFRESVLVHSQNMFASACAIVRDPEIASDCVQEVCIKMWESSERLEDIENIQAYCLTSVRRKALDYLRHRARMDIRPIEPDRDYPDKGYSYERRRDDKDNLSEVYDLMKSLPPNQKRVIELSGLGGLTNHEIEDATGLTADNVRVLLSRGRRKLRELFKKRENGDG